MRQSNTNKIVFVLFLVFVLVAIRAFESSLFYDPFIAYFKSEYLKKAYQDYNGFLLFLNYFFRYLLNSIISLFIIYVLFKDVVMIKFTSVLLVFFLIVLLVLLYLDLVFLGETQKMLLFYIRRFLIQPIFLLLFVPAFYFQKVTVKK